MPREDGFPEDGNPVPGPSLGCSGGKASPPALVMPPLFGSPAAAAEVLLPLSAPVRQITTALSRPYTFLSGVLAHALPLIPGKGSIPSFSGSSATANSSSSSSSSSISSGNSGTGSGSGS
eukprot:RCo042131